MTLIEIFWFIINLIFGILVGKYFWNNFGPIYSPIGFVLGFSVIIVSVKLLELMSKLRNKNSSGSHKDR